MTYSVEEVRDAAKYAGNISNEWRDMLLEHADLLEKIQRAKAAVTDEVVEISAKMYVSNGGGSLVNGYVRANMRDALQAVAHLLPRGEVTNEVSLSDALNVLEDYVVHGGMLYGDDAARFRATVDRLAPTADPVAQGESVECPECGTLCAHRVIHVSDDEIHEYIPMAAQPRVPDGDHPESKWFVITGNNEAETPILVFTSRGIAEQYCALNQNPRGYRIYGAAPQPKEAKS